MIISRSTHVVANDIISFFFYGWVVWSYIYLPANARDAGDAGLTPRSERCPRGGNGNLFQYSWLKNPMGRGAWWATVCGVARSRTWLSDQHFHFLSGLCLRRARLSKHLPNVKTKPRARTLECVAISSSRRPSWPRDRIRSSSVAGKFFTTEPHGKASLRAII